jgi:hypothetical protein
MITFSCVCGNTLFFNNTTCVSCNREVGMCPSCWQIVPPEPDSAGEWHCPTDHCDTRLVHCTNFTADGVCNQYVDVDLEHADGLCEFCRLTTVVPDSSVAGNHEKWFALESAKRRVLYMVRQLGLPLTPGDSGVVLSFEFKADASEPVFTGHDAGTITINIREADPVERERTRVLFGEPQRTLVGHIRHELGHYIWDRLIQHRDEKTFSELFGNHEEPAYAKALARYHENGPVANWQTSYVSAYATMHPWEDFAETFGAYLDMISVLDTAEHFRVLSTSPKSFDEMLLAYQRIGVLANEWNRDMGLVDLVPEVFTADVRKKLWYIHSLTKATTGLEKKRSIAELGTGVPS